MFDDICTLTTGDFAVLEALKERWTSGHALAPALRQKLNNARVVFPDDLKRDVATLDSRIGFTIDGGEMQVAKLTALSGLGDEWLPVSLPLGLALLGRKAGETFVLSEAKGKRQTVKLCEVLEQPERAWPGRFASPEAPAAAKPALRVVKGGKAAVAVSHWPTGDGPEPDPAA